MRRRGVRAIGLPGPAELPGHKILQFAVGGGQQGLQVGRAQKFRRIPGQVPPGQKTQVQGTPGDVNPAAIITRRPDLERQSHLGRQALDGQVALRPGGQFRQGCRQLPLPAATVL